MMRPGAGMFPGPGPPMRPGVGMHQEWHESAGWSDWGDGDWADDCFDCAEAWEGATEWENATEHLRERTGTNGNTATGMEAAVAPRTAVEVPAARAGRTVGNPLIDPPEFGDRVRDTDRDPFWIPGAFPTIFQNETGDPYEAPKKEVGLVL